MCLPTKDEQSSSSPATGAFRRAARRRPTAEL